MKFFFLQMMMAATSVLALEEIQVTPGLHLYKIEARDSDNDIAIYLPSQYDGIKPLPMIISAHGNGGNGPGEVTQWTQIAEQNGWIVICPTFKVSKMCNESNLKSDEKMLEELTKALFKSLVVQREYVLFTGHSGGGYAGWYLATREPELYTALCWRSSNFMGEAFGLKMKKWRNRPMYLFWGETEAPFAAKQNPEALKYLLDEVKPSQLKQEIIVGGGHESRPDLVAAWFLQVVQN
jgi:poly(3-hydroxybutyrate) depolymerase